MEKDFIPYKESLDLKELGFNEPCWGVYGYNRISKSVPDELIDKTILTFLPEISTNEDFHLNPRDLKNSNIGDDISAPTYSSAFRWFRGIHDLHVQIKKENYIYCNIHNNYFHFNISKGKENDITKQQELYNTLMDECEQNIPGNYLNNEKLNILIFEREFAFNTYEEAELACLKKCIELVKNK